MTSDYTNRYVGDDEGRLYRVTLAGSAPSGRCLGVARRGHDGFDVGRNLKLDGAKAKKLIARARRDFEVELRVRGILAKVSQGE